MSCISRLEYDLPTSVNNREILKFREGFNFQEISHPYPRQNFRIAC